MKTKRGHLSRKTNTKILSIIEESKVNELLDDEKNGLVVTIGNIGLYHDSIITLGIGEELNDEIMNSYIYTITNRKPKVYLFYPLVI